MFTTPNHKLLVYPLDNQTFDVFSGMGFSTWSRFRKEGFTFKLMKGNPLSTSQYTELITCLKSQA